MLLFIFTVPVLYSTLFHWFRTLSIHTVFKFKQGPKTGAGEDSSDEDKGVKVRFKLEVSVKRV